MEFEELLNKRYSCRKYTKEPVSRSDLAKLMDAGRVAPSSCNSQRWTFVAIDDPKKVEQITATMYNETWKINWYVNQLPALIAVVSHPVRNPTDSQKALLDDSVVSSSRLIDIGLAASQITLEARNIGLGSVIIGSFDSKIANQVLELPDSLETILFIGVGHSAYDKDHGRTTDRLPKEEICHFNSYKTT